MAWPIVVALKAELSLRWVFQDQLTIGQGESCNIKLNDPYVSTVHARLRPVDGHWLAEDLGSTNGSWMNGLKLYAPMRVAKGSRLRIGHTDLILVPAGPDDPADRGSVGTPC